MIKVQGLTKRYARLWPWTTFSFEVEKGQIVGFLGPNGAGKTTTMRVSPASCPTMGTANSPVFDVIENPWSQEAHRLPAGIPRSIRNGR